MLLLNNYFDEKISELRAKEKRLLATESLYEKLEGEVEELTVSLAQYRDLASSKEAGLLVKSEILDTCRDKEVVKYHVERLRELKLKYPDLLEIIILLLEEEDYQEHNVIYP